MESYDVQSAGKKSDSPTILYDFCSEISYTHAHRFYNTYYSDM